MYESHSRVRRILVHILHLSALPYGVYCGVTHLSTSGVWGALGIGVLEVIRLILIVDVFILDSTRVMRAWLALLRFRGARALRFILQMFSIDSTTQLRGREAELYAWLLGVAFLLVVGWYKTNAGYLLFLA